MFMTTENHKQKQTSQADIDLNVSEALWQDAKQRTRGTKSVGFRSIHRGQTRQK